MHESSFRGARFWTESGTTAGGRNTHLYEFPFGSSTEVADLGLRSRKFRISGFVIGDGERDWQQLRDELTEALETPGSGTLVHHWYGPREVFALSYSLSLTTANGGRAGFEMEFVEEAREEDVSVFSTSSAVIAAGEEFSEAAAVVAVEQGNAELGNLGGQSTLLDEAARSVAAAKEINRSELQKFLSSLGAAKDKIIAGVGFVRSNLAAFNGTNDEISSLFSDLAAEFRALNSELGELVNTPNLYVTRLDSLINSISSIGGRAGDAFGALDAAGGSQQPTQSAGRFAKNRVLAAQSSSLAAIEFEDQGGADEAFSALEARIAEAVESNPPELINPIRRLRATVYEHRKAVLATLPKTTQIEVPEPLPALFLAHRHGMSVEDFIALNGRADLLTITGTINVRG